MNLFVSIHCFLLAGDQLMPERAAAERAAQRSHRRHFRVQAAIQLRVVEGASFVSGPYCAMLAQVRGGMRRPKFRRSNGFRSAPWTARRLAAEMFCVPHTIAHSLSQVEVCLLHAVSPGPFAAVAFQPRCTCRHPREPLRRTLLAVSNSSLSCHRIRQSASDPAFTEPDFIFELGRPAYREIGRLSGVRHD